MSVQMKHQVSFYVSVLRVLRNAFRFRGSFAYWDGRYSAGGNSGEGSYGELAEFKAEFLNRFVEEQKIDSVIEFGCGDGNQLRLSKYGHYFGVEVSHSAIALCLKTFSGDKEKKFCLAADYQGETAELSLSLDVLYHLVEDEVFESYMRRLFAAASRYVIIYSSNSDAIGLTSPHVRHRAFSSYVEGKCKDWILERVVQNQYPIGLRTYETSFAHFFVYSRMHS